MKWRVPFFEPDIGEEEVNAVIKVIRGKWISMGGMTQEFERRFAEKLGVKHAIAVSNCTSALHLALLCCNIRPGDEVLVPSLTFVATVNAVRYVGANPIFVDIESLDRPLISCPDAEAKIKERTKAIIVMHYAGYPVKMEEITRIAKKHGFKVIEDSAHAPFVNYKGRSLGTWGEVGCFSFFSNKNLTTAEGGILTTNDDDIAQKARLMRSHGMTTLSFDRFKGHASSYDVVELGYNYRIDDIRSAIGIVQLNRFEKALKRRQEIVELYRKLLSEIEEVRVPFAMDKESSFHIQPVLVKEFRDRIREYMHSQGVQTSVHYPPAHKFRIYRTLNYELSKTEEYSQREITLPLYPSMDEGDVKFVVKSLKEAASTLGK